MPHGLQVFDSSGISILEVGSNVVRESPAFAEKIGDVSASLNFVKMDSVNITVLLTSRLSKRKC